MPLNVTKIGNIPSSKSHTLIACHPLSEPVDIHFYLQLEAGACDFLATLKGHTEAEPGVWPRSSWLWSSLSGPPPPL